MKKSLLCCDLCPNSIVLATDKIVVRGIVSGFSQSVDVCEYHRDEVLKGWLPTEKVKKVAALKKPATRNQRCHVCGKTTATKRGMSIHLVRMHP